MASRTECAGECLMRDCDGFSFHQSTPGGGMCKINMAASVTQLPVEGAEYFKMPWNSFYSSFYSDLLLIDNEIYFIHSKTNFNRSLTNKRLLQIDLLIAYIQKWLQKYIFTVWLKSNCTILWFTQNMPNIYNSHNVSSCILSYQTKHLVIWHNLEYFDRHVTL